MADTPKSNVVSMQGMRLARAFGGFARRLGLNWGSLGNFGGKRNLNAIFGWDELLSTESMTYMYNRGGIAKRIVDAFPNAIWGRPPDVYVDGDDAWNTAWEQLVEDFDLFVTLSCVDKLANLGEYAILLLGGGGKLDTPLKKASKLDWMQPYGQQKVNIATWTTDPNDANFGKPEFYTIMPGGQSTTASGVTGIGASTQGPVQSSFRVHYSRVIHVATGSLENQIIGTPRMAPCWDYLTDLRKVIGSASESYWIMANRGMQADVDKEMTLGEEDAAALAAEMEEFFDGFSRFIKTKGVTMKTLANDVADPSAAFQTLITGISGTTGIPQRVLIGSEAGQLASTQDKGNWAERQEEEISLYSKPRILLPVIRKFIALGILPTPSGKIKVDWPDVYRMSPLERGQAQAQTARSLANMFKAMGNILIQPAQTITTTRAKTPEEKAADAAAAQKALPAPGTPATGTTPKANAFPPPGSGSTGTITTTETIPAIYGKPLLTIDEARAILGLSTDNRVLSNNPQEDL